MKTLDIAFNLYTHYAQVEEINNYYGLLAIYGLVQAAYESKSHIQLERCRTLLDRYPDRVRHPYYNFPCYRFGGNGMAWALLHGMLEEQGSQEGQKNQEGQGSQEGREGRERLHIGQERQKGQPDRIRQLKMFADQTMAGSREANGILCMPGKEQEGWIWIDTLTAVTPFMLFAGLKCGRQDYIDFAAGQCFLMYDALLDPSCGLLHQCRGFRGEPDLCSEDHWSRGNGWGYLALAELVEYLPQDCTHRPRAEKYFKELSSAVAGYQTPKGLWRQEMTEPLSWEESSGSALFLYGLGIGLRTGLLSRDEYWDVFEKGLKGLLTYCINSDFSTERSCPGCLCPGEGEEKGTIRAYITEKLPVRDEHHSFGAFMLAMVEAHRNGITELTLCG